MRLVLVGGCRDKALGELGVCIQSTSGEVQGLELGESSKIIRSRLGGWPWNMGACLES